MAQVYRHRRLDNLDVFYIGISTSKWRATAKGTSRSTWWNSYTKKHPYYVEVIADKIAYDDAKELEILLIQEYGRRDLGSGKLLNMTDGGEGGLNPSKEVRAIMSNYSKNNVVSKETKDKISKANTGKKRTENHKKRISAKSKLLKHSEDTKKMLSSIQTHKVAVLQFGMDDVFIKKYDSIAQAARENNCKRNHITLVCKGLSKYCKGYKYKYDTL